MATLTIAEIRALTPEQIRSFSAEQLAALAPSQFQAFSAAQIQALTALQLTRFTREQMATFTPDQFGAMSPTQLTTLLLSVDTSLTVAQKEAIGNVLTATVNTSDTLVAGSGTGALPIAALGVAIRGASVRFEQAGSAIRLRMAEASRPFAVDESSVTGSYTPLIVTDAARNPVEFSVALIEGRVVIAARNATARTMLMSDMPVVLASAVTMLSTSKPIVLAALSGLVLDLR